MNIDIKVQSNIDKILNDIINSIANTVGDTSIQVGRKLDSDISTKAPNYTNQYMSAIALDISPYDFVFSIRDSKLSNIDRGQSSYDMKPGFRRNVQISKSGGWYKTIPFRHKTPPTNSNNSLSWSVYSQVRTMPLNRSYQDNSSPLMSHTGYRHKSSKLQGLRRIVASYGSNYYTFRRVSNNSDLMSWIHPGKKGINIFESIPSYANMTFTDLMTQNLSLINLT